MWSREERSGGSEGEEKEWGEREEGEREEGEGKRFNRFNRSFL